MDIATDHNAQMRTNPVFQTAKTAVCLMAKADIPDSSAIVHALGVKEDEVLQSMADPDILLGNALVVETKYRTMCSLIKASGYHTCADLPCGYTPKALRLTEEGIRFIGLDLPIVADEMEPVIRSLATHPERMSFYGVDATNLESLVSALRNENQPLCITTEGMMMYFNESEVNTVISNIRSILEIHGGSWITPDPEFMLQFFGSFRSVFGERFLEKLATTKVAAKEQSDVSNLCNSFILNPADALGSAGTAEETLRKHGLKVEKINLAEHMPTLNIYRQLTQRQISNFQEEMKQCHYWAITLDGTQARQNLERIQDKVPFDMRCSIENNVFQVSLCGRLDSLTAPSLLTAWEHAKDTNTINSIEIDCSKLYYITSAGVRVLLILQEGCEFGVTLNAVNCHIDKMLTQKQFTKISLQQPS